MKSVTFYKKIIKHGKCQYVITVPKQVFDAFLKVGVNYKITLESTD